VPAGAPPSIQIEPLSQWQVAPSEGVAASVSTAEGRQGKALQLDFDFRGMAGYAAVRRAFVRNLSSNFELSFYIRGAAPANNLQIKLIDPSGENVWWVSWPDYEFPTGWQRVTIKKRQVQFAWGPTKDRTLRNVAQLEMVVNAGRGGGHGTVQFDDLKLRELPPQSITHPSPAVRASSAVPNHGAAAAADGDDRSVWRSDPRSGTAQLLTLDLRERREFGGLTVSWEGQAYASRYDVEVSDDARKWRTMRHVTAGHGGLDFLCLPESEARYVRLHLLDGPAGAYGVREINVKDPAFCESPAAFFQTVARNAPRGRFPRGMSGEQSYWTVVGVDAGVDQALLSEDGSLEPGRGQFSVEPLVRTSSGVLTWADVEIEHSLEDGYLPMPSVRWRKGGLSLRITAFASGAASSPLSLAEYELANDTGSNQDLALVLAVRPFQVNPPTQFLNSPGGASPIRTLAWQHDCLVVNGRRILIPLQRPDRVSVVSYDAGQIPELISAGTLPRATTVSDEFGYASGALVYNVHLAPGERATLGLVAPLTGMELHAGEPSVAEAFSHAASPPAGGPASAAQLPPDWLAHQHQVAAAEWRRRLNRVTLRVPKSAAAIADTVRSALAHILIERDGAALQPGARSYRRAWIRDGALMSSALLRLGEIGAAKDFLYWYAPRQFESGKVPCCVDKRGADPVAENDSPGELIYLTAEIWRYTGDRALLETLWPHVSAAADYMTRLRDSERTPQNEAPERRELFGLLPASISHEGYSSKPMHSYWDDFWALRGYKDAAEIATALGREEAARRLSLARDEFANDVYASLRAAVAKHGIDFLPGCAELGDFDATSTTVALSPGGEQTRLPPELLQATFERYWREFTRRRDGLSAWEDYTPYELRVIGTFVRLGRRDRAQQALEFFLRDRRPAEWNQWAEVVGRDPRQPRFIGDMPHGWVASDFIRSVLDLFGYSRESDRALVIAAGLPASWLQGDGIGIDQLRTEYGPLSYTFAERKGRATLQLAAGLRMPPGGIVLAAPWSATPRLTLINGQLARWNGGELRIRELPATVAMEL
jgi:hypothetical protein